MKNIAEVISNIEHCTPFLILFGFTRDGVRSMLKTIWEWNDKAETFFICDKKAKNLLMNLNDEMYLINTRTKQEFFMGKEILDDEKFLDRMQYIFGLSNKRPNFYVVSLDENNNIKKSIGIIFY